MQKKIILASNSPRRKELLEGLNIDFEVRVIKDIDESYPSNLSTKDIAEFISLKKALAYNVADDEILITADTIVVLGDEVMGKPKDAKDAKRMLQALSGKTHQVITGCYLKSATQENHFSVTTAVTFKRLTDEEIEYYITTYKPFDKAGAYGIQEWIGYIAVIEIKGSFFNVVGFPVQRIYEALNEMM